jgi:hypothetical protein
MRHVNVKAQGLLNAAKFIETEYGQAALRDVIRACSPAVRDRYVSAIAINWHPMSELVELLSTADRLLGKGDGRIAEQIGASSARANLKGAFVRFAMYAAKPELLMKRVAGLWHQFNDEGEMQVLRVDEKTGTVDIQVVGLTETSWVFCCTITGWSREVALAMGFQDAQSRHAECVTKGGHRCVWHIRGKH